MNLEELQKNRSMNAFDIKDEHIEEITETIKEAGTKDEPFPVTETEGKLKIIGDASKIEREAKKYKLTIMLDKKEFTKEVAEELNKEEELREFGNIYLPVIEEELREITPSMRRRLNSSISGIIGHLSTFENGKLELFSAEAMTRDNEYRLYMDDVVMDSIHEVVNCLFNIPDDFKDKVQSHSAIQFIITFIFNNPDVVNEVMANFN